MNMMVLMLVRTILSATAAGIGRERPISTTILPFVLDTLVALMPEFLLVYAPLQNGNEGERKKGNQDLEWLGVMTSSRQVKM